VEEIGSEVFMQLVTEASEIVVSPVTWIEINATIERRLNTNLLTSERASWLRAEVKKDFAYFLPVVWNENLETKAVEIVRRHPLKTMDAIQLASGILSGSDMFVTSDHRLHQAAKKIIPHVRFI
jgi:predicted nucleic acid-binding protein